MGFKFGHSVHEVSFPVCCAIAVSSGAEVPALCSWTLQWPTTEWCARYFAVRCVHERPRFALECIRETRDSLLLPSLG